MKKKLLRQALNWSLGACIILSLAALPKAVLSQTTIAASGTIGASNTSKTLQINSEGHIFTARLFSGSVILSKSTNNGATFADIQTFTGQSLVATLHITRNNQLIVALYNTGTATVVRSTDNGVTFTAPENTGVSSNNPFRVDSYLDRIYILNNNATTLGYSASPGVWATTALSPSRSFSGLMVNQNDGTVYVFADNGTVYGFKSTNGGVSFTSIAISPSASAQYSTYTLLSNDGDKIFAGSAGIYPTTGSQIDPSGAKVAIVLVNSPGASTRQLIGDAYGNLVDAGNNGGTISIRSSFDKGLTWGTALTFTGTAQQIAINTKTGDVGLMYINSGVKYQNITGLIQGVTIGATAIQVCLDNANNVQTRSQTINFSKFGTFVSGSQFDVELSDAAGSFASPVIIGTTTDDAATSISVTLPATLTPGNYFVRIKSTTPALYSTYGNVQAGLCRPEVTTLSPLNNATGVGRADNLVITFNKNVSKGTGKIYIKNTSDDTLVEEIDVTSNKVSIAAAVVTIDPAANLPGNRDLYVTVDATAFKDALAVEYAGIANKTTWKFQTSSLSPQAITFALTRNVAYGSSDFSPGAVSDNAGIPITYISSNTAVATIVSGMIHILKAGTTNITASQAGDSNNSAAGDKVQALTITAKPITLTLNATPAITKVYDGTITATLATGNYTLAGLEGSDDVTASGTATYDTKDFGAGKAVTVATFVLAGAQKDNYSLSTTTATTTGAVTAKSITLTLNATPAITKVYDGTNTATLAAGNYTLTGLEGSDAVTATGTATYDTKDFGTGKTVTASTFVLAGAQKDNYSLSTTTATTTGAVTAKPITLTLNAIPAITKVYDGTTTASLVAGNYTLAGLEGSDAVTATGTATYDTKDFGTGKTVTAATFILAGAQKDNYSLTTTTATTTGAVTAKSITLTLNAIPAITKVYNGTAAATLSAGNYTLAGLEGSDAVTATGTATYDSKDFGTGKTVTAATFVLAGSQKDNYTLTTTTATTTGGITAKPITLTLNATPAITKVYDGTTTASLATGNYTLTGLEGSDAVTATVTATYDTKNFGTGKTITASTFVLAGAQKDNYSLTTTTATTTGAVTAKSITLTLNATPAITKVYNGTAAATLAAGNYTLTGLEGSDAVTATGTATYDTKDFGTGKTITAATFVLAGAQKDNYSLTTTTATTTGAVTAKPITLTLNATPAITKVYDGNTAATLSAGNYTLAGLEGNDAVTATGTATYDTKNFGTGKTITASTFVLAGAQKDNYNLTTATATTTGAITAKPVTVSVNATPAVTKVYNGNNNATLVAANYSVAGVETGDVVAASGTPVYDDLNAGNGKTIMVTGLTLNGASANNYSVSNTSASTTGSITPKAITATANATPLISKAYNGNTNATIVAGNISLTGLVGADQVVASGTASYASSSAGNKAVAINGIILEGSARNNYQLSNTTAATNGTITQKTVTITADNKTKVQNLPNPPLTASYTGFINGESNSVLTTQPTLTTTATTTSVQGTYSIIASGAIATNYSFTYVPGTLTVSPGAPSTVSLANVTLYENQAPGTNAGTLNSTSDDPNATFTYALVNGSGDTDNALFAIAGNQLNTSASLNYENKPSYSVRVRSTSQYGLSLDQVFNVAINDVNEAPTIASIPNQTTCFTTAQQTFTITGISAGPETSQNVTLSFTNNNADLFSQIAITNAGVFTYTVKPGQSGTATILVTAQDNGGVANGGIDVATKAFIISVNALPVMSVTVDGGTDVSKGATTTITATGGVGYTWANATGIISGQNAAALTVRPLITTTYTVTVSNSSGCTTTQSITLNVMEDFKALEATNVMSPNSDGTNDVFVIKNIEVYPNNDLKVFDRAGRIVFSAKGYKNTWDATINGSPLTEGTYYYVVDFGDGKMKKKGYITIIRN